MNGFATIAAMTFAEARRRKILTAALLLGLAFLAVYATGFYFADKGLRASPRTTDLQRRVALMLVVMAGLYAVNFLTIMAAILLPVDTLSGEIESGVMQTLATKPIRRSEILLGKWVGFGCVLALYLALMAGGVLVVARVIGGFTPPNVWIGLPLMLLEGVLFLSISIAGGTRLGTLANGVMGFGLFGLAFIGGWMEQIGTRLGSAATRDVGIVSSLLVPSEALWQMAAYHMQPPVMRDVPVTPFAAASLPSPAMVVWAGAYVVMVIGIALWNLRRRDL
jgi:ABC-type transport system involved in multi-copper enzyme maturation permease subunit